MESLNEFKVLLFELGSVQVFTSLTTEEIVSGIEYRDVYWQDKVSKYTYGPFNSIHACMVHYTSVIANQKTQIIGEEHRAPVIYVDFRNKTRIVYE